MGKSKQSVGSAERESTQQLTPLTFDEEDSEEEHEEQEQEQDTESDDELAKDEAEIQLERLVFGDSGGFRDGLRDFDKEEEAADEETTGLEGLDDAQVGQIARDYTCAGRL